MPFFPEQCIHSEKPQNKINLCFWSFSTIYFIFK